MNALVEIHAAAQGFNWSNLIVPLVTFAGVIVTVLIGVRTTRRTLESNGLNTRHTIRANILSTSRLKWLETFRTEFAELLAFGERLYEARVAPPDAASEAEVRVALTRSSKRLIVLLGREDSDRLDMAEHVRAFAVTPTAELAEMLEIRAQKLFRGQWNKVRTETGEEPRAKLTLSRPATLPSDTTDD